MAKTNNPLIPPITLGDFASMSEQEYQWRMEKMRQLEEIRYQERMEQVAKQRAPSGIADWHNQGFETRVLTEVRNEIASMQKNHRSDMNELKSEMRHAKKQVEHINGFYTWLIETYPETVAQYKALMDLQKASEQPTRLTRDMP
jgi:hypothetical protein